MTIAVVIILFLAVGVGFLAFFFVKNILLPRRAQAAAGLLSKNQNLQAIRAGKTAVEKDPKDAEAHWNLGKAYLAEERNEQALREFKSVSRLGIEGRNIPETEFRQTVAKLYAQYNETEEALKEYVLLIKKQPETAEYYFQAGVLFSKRSRGDLAEQYLKKAISLSPRDVRSYYELGVLLCDAKKTREANATLEAALKLDPNNPKIHFYLGKTLKDAKDFSGALPFFEKAARDQEFKGRALVESGSCCMSLKMLDKAVSELERAVNAINNESDPDSLYARYFLGMCYEKKQDFARALAQWDSVYAKKKNFRDVGEKLTQYQQYRQDDTSGGGVRKP
jgi:tetratricopeptide (TPR) repeat protein